MQKLLASRPVLSSAAEAMAPGELRRFCLRLIDELLNDTTPVELRPHCSLLQSEAVQAHSQMAADALRLSEQYDNEYFDIQEQGGNESEWSRRFQQARLAYAVGLCLGRGGSSDRIIYELAHASGDPTLFLASAEKILAGFRAEDGA